MTTNREAWLTELTEELRPLYNGELPEIVRISTGFPSAGMRGRAIGECWNGIAATDKAPQVFIHPRLYDTVEVAAVVAHELIHAARPDAKHGPKFKEVALRIGLQGKMTATTAGPAFRDLVAPIIEKIGEYPHASLRAAVSSNGPTQTTRMLKCECPECGYTVRTSQKWLDVAVPTCPACKTSYEEGPEMVVGR